MGQTLSFLPSLITSCNPSNVSAPLHSKPGQLLNWQREDLTEGCNTERGFAGMARAGDFTSAPCARSRLYPGNRLASLQKPGEKKKKRLYPGEPGEAQAGGRATGDRGHGSVLHGGRRSCKELQPCHTVLTSNFQWRWHSVKCFPESSLDCPVRKAQSVARSGIFSSQQK